MHLQANHMFNIMNIGHSSAVSEPPRPGKVHPLNARRFQVIFSSLH